MPLTEIVSSSGSSTGRLASETGTGPQFEQCIIGIGVPQYLCLEINQSLSLEDVQWPPILRFLSNSIDFSRAFSLVNPLN